MHVLSELLGIAQLDGEVVDGRKRGEIDRRDRVAVFGARELQRF